MGGGQGSGHLGMWKWGVGVGYMSRHAGEAGGKQAVRWAVGVRAGV